jgi:ubiquitin-like domain-containing CTD phosphatase 1
MSSPDNDDVISDFEDGVVEVENREENLLKISDRVKEYKVEVLSPPREGRKLLVQDGDYTLALIISPVQRLGSS